jgi:hypothetical protein
VEKNKEITVKEDFQGKILMQKAEIAATRVAASARAEVESAFIMALKMPRNRDQARIEILQACKNITFASMAKYKKPVGKKQTASGEWVQNYVEGPSIRFAEEMIRSWTNVKVQSMIIYEDDERRITFINVVDLQSNISYSSQITVEKTIERKSDKGREVIDERLNSYGERVFIVRATDDEIRNKEAAMLSKEIRNASLRLIPQDITQDAMAQVDVTVKAGVSSDIETAKKQILDAFAAIGVKPVDLEQYLGHAMSTVSPAEIADLRTVYNTIKNGEATWADYVAKEVVTADQDSLNGPPKDPVFKAGDPAKHQDVRGSAAGKKGEGK